jgi:hypothetical protein
LKSRRFGLLPGRWAVVRFPADAPVPEWALRPSPFVSISRTADELSIVCPEAFVTPSARCEGGWQVIKLLGPFPFEEVGILASFAAPLAAAGVAIFAISTFDTDYILIKSAQVEAAVDALRSAGHELVLLEVSAAEGA